MSERLKPRGTDMMLPHGGLPEFFSSYMADLIQQTGGIKGPLGLQFVAQKELEQAVSNDDRDPLLEAQHENEMAPGIVYKYEAGEDQFGPHPGRVLFTITRKCATYCRYCTREDIVGVPNNIVLDSPRALAKTPTLSRAQIDQSLEFIKNTKGINEVIVSGGDPLTVDTDMLMYLCTRLGDMKREGKLDIIRIGTRLPIHNPRLMKPEHYEALSKIPYAHLMIHVNHPWELTDESLDVLHKMKQACDGVVMSQSVLLRGVNDNPQVLRELFNAWAREGFVAYYLYNCDPLPIAQHFYISPQEGYERVWRHIRPVLSGVAATARYVIDTPDGYGKIPLPDGGAWDFIINHYRDFKGTEHQT